MKYLIREWDGTLAVVTMNLMYDHRGTEDCTITYEDGTTHIVTTEYFYSIKVREPRSF
jgi:hypothetical protein